jgi:flavin-dependent dehydrogenase
MTVDVCIAGGGLAGLTLARQLRQTVPALEILVLEKRTHPAPEAAHKVGESSVEIGAHYFGKVLGLEPHLHARQLPKLGLRYFFPADGNRRLESRFELGPANFPPVPSYQLDRGRLENYLLESDRDLGIDVRDRAVVREVAFGSPHHRIEVETPEGRHTVHARWLVDATGRHALIRRRLDLTRDVAHLANACWWRVNHSVRLDHWVDDPAWKARVPSGERWLSTNHLMGRGYWVWLIPLGSGTTSFGIVADAALHPYNRLNRFEKAIEWLREFEPQCATYVERDRDENRVEDFLALKHFAHGCARVYSSDRWLLTGEAGVFTDPFYSPGSDFIGMSNTFITDLIARDHRGEDVGDRLERFNTLYLQLFEAFLRVYTNQYPIMGNAQVMTLKAAWDNGSYWAIPALLFFQQRLIDPAFMASIDTLMKRYFVLHARMQMLLHEWNENDDSPYGAGWTNVIALEPLRRLQAELGGPGLDDDPLRAALESNLALLERFAQAIQARATETDASLGRFVAAPAPGDTPPFDISALTLPRRPVPAAGEGAELDVASGIGVAGN